MQMQNSPDLATRRGTFVGTVNYLAPEMIEDCSSTCDTDLWALGCIIFKMATGKVPFPGLSQEKVFPLIRKRHIDWPENQVLDPECKALIDELLQLEPSNRLGSITKQGGVKAVM